MNEPGDALEQAKMHDFAVKLIDALKKQKNLTNYVKAINCICEWGKKIYSFTRLKGIIPNLIVITNNVYANVSNSEYEEMNNSLSGTFVYWELNSNNKILNNE